MMDPNQQLQAAYRHFQEGDLDTARNLALDLEKSLPHAVPVLHLLGVIEKTDHNFEQSEHWLQKASTIGPANPEILNTLGLVLETLGKETKARSIYQRAIQANPDYLPARQNLANSMGLDPSLAVQGEAEARAMINLSPKLASAWSVLGLCLKTQERHIEALEAFDKAIDFGADDVATLQNRGGILLALRKHDEAEAVLESLIECGEDNTPLHFMIAQAKAENGDPQTATAELETCWKSEPSPVILKNLASLYWMLEDKVQFFSLIDQTLESASTRPDLALAAVNLLKQSGENEVAQERFSCLPDTCKDQADYYALSAYLAQDSGDLESSVNFARKAIANSPNSYATRCSLIVPLLMLGQHDEAMKEILAARELAPMAQDLIGYYTTALRMAGRLDEYAEFCDMDRFVRAYELEPPEGWSSIKAFNSDLSTAIDNLRVYKTHPLDQSLRQGNQTPRSLLGENDPVIQAYVKSLDAPIRNYIHDLGTDPSHPLMSRNTGDYQLRGSFSVRLKGGGYHVNHIHPQGWVSGPYYIEVPPGIEDEPDHAGWVKFGEPSFDTPVDMPPDKWICPKEGVLVLFPSYMWHGTQPTHPGAKRVTAPIDVSPA